ncbi:MAG: PAS domain-containing protein [Chloroflexi bacterium]|nr:PAS domain-containing protein [Chloroflexota bacterium]
MSFFRSLRWRIALSYTALIFLSMGAVSLYLVDRVRDDYMSDLQERLTQEARLAGEITTRYFRGPLDAADLNAVSSQVGNLINARVTIVARDGTVLADNWEDPAGMENHARRPEIQAALNTGLGRSTRFSATVRRELLYTAVPIRVDGTLMGVARVAVPTSEVHKNVRHIVGTIALAAFIVAALSVTLGLFVAHRTSRSIRSVAEGARRLGKGELEHRVVALSADETQELAEAFNRMAAALRSMFRDLDAERSKLSAVLDTMGDGIIVAGPDGKVLLMNPAAERLVGVKSGATGTRFMEVVRDHELQRLVSQCLQTGRQQVGELELLHRRRFLSAVATPLGGVGGIGVLLTLHDLTRTRQVETMRKEFVSNVSHELRSPLAAIKAMVETLEAGALEEQDVAHDFLGRIHRDVDRMNAMVEDMLEISRLESGQEVVHPIPMDLRPLVEEVEAQFEARAAAKGVALDARLPDDLPPVLGEQEKLRQVLVNLLDNAFKATPENGAVTISASAGEGAVEVKVSDTGVGIAPEHLPHIFERFYKVDRSRRDGGTGLGLAIVKHIVEAHGGGVRVESREGEGSTFSFTLPRVG